VSAAGKKKSFLHTARTPLLGFAFLVVLLLPGVLIGIFLLSGAASILLFGALPVAAAYFGGATNSTVRIIAFMVVSGSLARFFDQEPVPSALLIAAVAFISGISARRGLSSPVLLVGVSLGFLVISPPALGESGHQLINNIDPVLATAALLLIGGLWARLIIAGVQKWIPATPETQPRTEEGLVPYALALAISTGISTYFLLIYVPNGVGAWLILTIFVVLKVDTQRTVERTRDRVLGTLSGAVVAFIVIELLQALNWAQGFVQITLALLFIGAAMSYFVPGPYWKYVFFLTPGVVLLDSNAVSDQVTVDAWRVGFTLMGVTIALLSGLVVREVTRRLIHRK
jgi:hypothetical protein